jgi:hypothetical protein
MSTVAPPPPDSLSLALLQSTRTYPAISVLASTGGDPAAVRARLAALVAEADARLRAEPDQDGLAALVADLRRLAADTPVDTGAAALALFVARGSASAVHLPIGVRDRVVIDETFATRDLVHARARSPRYRVLTVGDRLCRLYEGLGTVLDQVHGGGVPVDLPAREEPQRSDRLRQERDGRRDEQMRRTVQAVDAALAPHLRDDPTPLFVVGAERRVAHLRETSRFGHLVTAAVVRPADRLAVPALAALVRPHVDAMLGQRQVQALGELEQARGARRYAAGIGEAWPLAAGGRVALLVVEEGFAYPARVDPVTNAVEPAPDVAAPDVVDDLVDETIEAVLGARGRVVLVPDGTLAGAGGIALAVRW